MLEKNLEMSATDFAAEIITITINNLNLNRRSVDEECMTDVKKVVFDWFVFVCCRYQHSVHILDT